MRKYKCSNKKLLNLPISLILNLKIIQAKFNFWTRLMLQLMLKYINVQSSPKWLQER